MDAIRLNPDLAFKAHVTTASALLQYGYDDAAIMHLRKAIALQPDSSGVHNSLGVILAKQGKTNEALAEFETALRLDPRNEAARTNEETAEALVHGSMPRK